MAKEKEVVYDFENVDFKDLDWDHFNKAYDKHFEGELAKSAALEEGLQIGKLFSIGVADGTCYYEVVKMFKTKVHIKLRGDLCLDGYCDHHFCGGGSFDRAEVERYIAMRDAMAAILNKQKKQFYIESETDLAIIHVLLFEKYINKTLLNKVSC